MIISVESLDRMFEDGNNPARLDYRGKCVNCGSVVTVEISRTSGGYGLLGGVLLESETESYSVVCANCRVKADRTFPGCFCANKLPV